MDDKQILVEGLRTRLQEIQSEPRDPTRGEVLQMMDGIVLLLEKIVRTQRT